LGGQEVAEAGCYVGPFFWHHETTIDLG
jgi:hypothetical protein